MKTYRRFTDRMDIYIEEARKKITVRLKWKYKWNVKKGSNKWTNDEQWKFHKDLDGLIWSTWGERFYLKSKGTSEFAQRNANTRWDLDFDIQKVPCGEHWSVNVTKVKSGEFNQSSIIWANRKINLDTEDIKKTIRKGQERSYQQYAGVHEFGHTIGNTAVFDRGDEYFENHEHAQDKSSVMNIGSEIRTRHLWYVLAELNQMIPKTKFVTH